METANKPGKIYVSFFPNGAIADVSPKREYDDDECYVNLLKVRAWLIENLDDDRSFVVWRDLLKAMEG